MGIVDTTELKFKVEGMDCANCALTLERSLAQVTGVEQVQVNFSTATLQARASCEPEKIIQKAEALGYRLVVPGEPAAAPAGAAVDGMRGFGRYLLSSRQSTLALLLALVLLATAPLGLWRDLPAVHRLQTLVQVSAALLAGYPIANKGLRALLVGRQVTIDLLMSLATLGALLIGETGEAATVILLFAVGEALEGYTAERARRSLRSLLALKPERAQVLRPCLDCAEHLGQDGYTGGACPFCGSHVSEVPVQEVQLGEIVLVRPGERIPVDGLVRSGVSAVNQAPVTGESIPVAKVPGETVYAGALNGEGALEIEVTRLAQDSTISRIVRLVEEAQARRAPVERFIDRFAAWYTPAVVGAAVLLAVVPPLAWGAPFLDTPGGERGWLYRALALLIVACPCALVISTPVTMVSALTALARRGILVKGAAFLDALARVRVFAFDKTGTLTLGQPVVVQTRTLTCADGQERCAACDEMLAQAAAVESRSEHPLAQAILAESRVRQLEHLYPAAGQVTALTGKGVRGMLNGNIMTISSHLHSHEFLSEDAHLHAEIERAEAAGQTVMLVSKDRNVVGFIGVADTPRSSSQETLAALKKLIPQARTVMLTGDHLGVAEKIAQAVGGVDEIRAGLLPGDKEQVVRSLESAYGPVAMIGDGINDAPALAAATVGIAMGGAGSAQAMETADIILMQDNLAHLPDAVAASRKARRIIWQNIIFSLALKAVFLLLTLPGWATLWMAVFADMGASLLVTFNGMRMLKPVDGK